jgi:hypothetical protein
MPNLKQRLMGLAAGLVMCSMFAVVPSFAEQGHVVSPADMQKAAVASTSTRQKNEATVNRFLSSPQTREALQSVHMTSEQVKTAVSNLSDQEVAQLAARSSKAEADFAAGNISDHDLILIALAALVVVIIIVAVR